MTVPPKPDCWEPEYAQTFNDEAVARAYHLRPAYPEGLFTKLAELLADRPGVVLDLGCGPGDLARRLAPVARRVDAVDVSLAMIERGREMEGGNHPGLRWIHGRAEDAPLSPPYTLVVAGDSLHWMDWAVVVPRIREVLSPDGLLAIAGRVWATGQPEEGEILRRYGTNKRFRPLNLVQELESRGLFLRHGGQGFTDVWRPTIDEYIGARHSQASFPTDPGEAEASDRDTRELLERLVREGRIQGSGGRLEVPVTSGVAWGRPG